MTDQLKKCRDQIDAIDAEILKLVNDRANLAKTIGSLKDDGVIYRPEREAQVLRRLIEENTGPLSSEAVTSVFRAVVSNCRALEKDLSVAYLGPSGTFSEEAATKQFGDSISSMQCKTIDEVFHMVEMGKSHYGVVPVENSTEGAIGRTLDLLMETDLNICGEVTLAVHHNLLSTNTDISSVSKVYSHMQSLAQCHEWLSKHLPNAEQQAVASNAEASRLSAQDPDSAAIASKRAGELFELNMLAESIEDDPKNTTRFLVLSKNGVAPSGQDKTSLAVVTKNVPGAMVALLEPLSRHNVSMTKLESRPSKAAMWEYVFFVDIEGHTEDAAVQQALSELSEKSTVLKVLGSYPLAVI